LLKYQLIPIEIPEKKHFEKLRTDRQTDRQTKRPTDRSTDNKRRYTDRKSVKNSQWAWDVVVIGA